jgi:hypothetical protein
VDDPIETEDDETAADVLLAARRWQITCARTGGRVSGAVKAAEAGLRTAVSRFGEDVPDLHEARRAARLASPLPAE